MRASTIVAIDSAFSPVGAHNAGLDISGARALAPPAGATAIMISTSTKDVRFTLDGTAPTASVGFLLVSGATPIIVPIGPGVSLKVIEVAASAVLQYQWIR